MPLELYFTITGNTLSNQSRQTFSERKLVTLHIVNVPRITIDQLINDSKNYINEMKAKNISIAGINNLFNERYYDYVVFGAGASTNIDYYPAIGRNFVTGMKYRF